MARRAGPSSAPPRRAAGAGGRRARQFFDTYTRDMTAEDLQRLFTHETVEAYRYFARDIDRNQLDKLPPLKRSLARIRLFFLAFSMRLPPARRALFAVAVLISALGLITLFEGVRLVTVWLFPFGQVRVPAPTWADGTGAMALGTGLFALLVLLEVAGRLSLKHDLEIAREIQLAMLPRGVYTAEGIEAFGFTRPANTVGGDFFDILPIRDGRVVVALGDVAGKASPAALLMALLLAIMRTLVDEGLEPAEMVSRLNVQTGRQAPGSRFITLFYACFDPRTGELAYVNAGHHPALLRHKNGEFERLTEGGIALGMFEGSTYTPGRSVLDPGDLVVLYSDGITEAENSRGVPFDEHGLMTAISACAETETTGMGDYILRAVERHAGDTRFADDLTLLILRRSVVVAGAPTSA